MDNFGSLVVGINEIRYNLVQLKLEGNVATCFEISKLVGLHLERVGSLDFSFTRGACGTYHFGNTEKILFCFNLSSTDKKCHT